MGNNKLWFASVILLAVILVSVALLYAYSFFNSRQIQILVEDANERGKHYELIIHNPVLNTYSFKVTE